MTVSTSRLAPELSVLIPTWNRCEILDDTLETLAHQQGVDGRWEIVVIDDGSTDDTSAVAARHAAAGLPLRCIRQPNLGLNAGRNRAFAESRGRILAYLDDDVLLPATWAAAVLDAFAAMPHIDALAGRLILRFEDEAPAWLTERLHHYLSRYDLGDAPRPLQPGESPRGANFAIRRATLEALGGWDPRFEGTGDPRIPNGEPELFRRLDARGGTTVYWPDAWAYHRVFPRRLSPEWFRRRVTVQGIGDAILDRPATTAGRAAAVGREAVRLGRAVPILASGLASGRGSLNADLWARYCWARLTTFVKPPVLPGEAPDAPAAVPAAAAATAGAAGSSGGAGA